MKSNIIFALLLTFTAISRFFLIDKIPPNLNQVFLTGRILSGGASLVSAVMVFFLVKKYFGKPKIALLTSWVFSILPWTFEQGRIISQPNLTLALVMSVLFICQRVNFQNKKILLFLIPVIFFFLYPQFWIFRVDEFKFNFYSFIYNLFTLLSFDFLFFKNTSFWWGGVKESGVMFLSFLPFFLVGIYNIIHLVHFRLILLFLLITAVSAASRFFPETREFYLSTPILAIVVGLGIYYCFLQTKFAIRIFFAGLFFLMIYEFSQFYHFYFIHYPQEVRSNFSQIHESF